MKNKQKSRKPALKEPMSGGIGTKPITGPLDPKRATRPSPDKSTSRKRGK